MGTVRLPPTSSWIFAPMSLPLFFRWHRWSRLQRKIEPWGHPTTCGLRSKIGFTRNRCTGVYPNIAMLSVLLGDILFLNIKNWGLSRQCHFMSILSSSFCENAEAIPAWLAMDWQIIRKTWRSDTDCFTGNSLISFGGSKSLIPPMDVLLSTVSSTKCVLVGWFDPNDDNVSLKKPHTPCVSSSSGRIHKPTRDWYRSCRWWTRPRIANNGAHSGRCGATAFANFVRDF